MKRKIPTPMFLTFHGRHTLRKIALTALLGIFLANSPSPTFGTQVSAADCISVSNVRFDHLGYNLDLAAYLSESQKTGLDPSVSITISWGSKKCNILPQNIKINQFLFHLQIPGYREGIELSLREAPAELLDFNPTYQLVFSVPQIKPSQYQPKLRITDKSAITNNVVLLALNYFINVPVTTVTSSPTPAPSATAKPPIKSISKYQNLGDNQTVWTIGSIEKLYSCWNSKPKSLKLQAKVKGVWLTKASAKISKDQTLCSKKFPWVARYSWAPDEFGDIPKKGSSARYLLVRELVNGTKTSSPISRVIYANNADRIQDGLNAIEGLIDFGLR